jgi:hypothetical protein
MEDAQVSWAQRHAVGPGEQRQRCRIVGIDDRAQLNRKSDLSRACGSSRRSAAEPGSGRDGSGGFVLEQDLLAG